MRRLALAIALLALPGASYGQTAGSGGSLTPPPNAITIGGANVGLNSANLVLSGPVVLGSMSAGIFGATLNVASVTGPLAIGMQIGGPGVAIGTKIVGSINGTGGAGSYTISPSQTITTETMVVYGQGPMSDASSFPAPAYASGGCSTTPAITGNPFAWQLTNGASGCSGSTMALNFPAATHQWNCATHDITSPSTTYVEQSAISGQTGITLTNYTRTTGAPLTWAASDVIIGTCLPF